MQQLPFLIEVEVFFPGAQRNPTPEDVAALKSVTANIPNKKIVSDVKTQQMLFFLKNRGTLIQIKHREGTPASFFLFKKRWMIN